jgi:polyferredoxin
MVGSFDLLQFMLSRSEFPWFALASIFIIGALFGRLLCGWACPFGFLQYLVSTFRSRHLQVSPKTHDQFKSLKLFILALTVLISGSLFLALEFGIGKDYSEALGVFAKGPFLAISPDGALFGTIPMFLREGGNLILKASEVLSSYDAFVKWIWSVPSNLVLSFILLAISFYGAYMIPLFWCRYLCPVGGFLGIFGRFSFLGMKRDPLKCTKKCPDCVRVCPMQVRILELPWEKFNDQECIFCLDCVEACPNGALGLKFP